MLYIDFEFNRTTHKNVHLVCCTTDCDEDGVKEWWLHKDLQTQRALKEYLLSKQSEIIFGWATVAESRSFLSLKLNPVIFDWIDGFLEYRNLSNHSDKFMYGMQLHKDGKVRMTKRPPPKWERTEEDSANSFKQSHSLAEATYKLTGKVRDQEHKNKMRDLIISDPEEFTAEERRLIQEYCTEDVIFLREIYEAIMAEYMERGFTQEDTPQLHREMFLRGNYAALTAKMESLGYPINVAATRNFSSAIPSILEECQREINQLFPAIKPFRWNKKDNRFSMNQKVIREWLVQNVDYKRWMKTDGFDRNVKLLYRAAKERGEKVKMDDIKEQMDHTDYLSLALEAWTRVFDYKHDYPKDNFGAQMVRYLKLKQNLAGFVENEKGSFWDAVGPDGRVRYYQNPYGSQSSRSQPPSKSFLFLKPAWMRALCQPPKGRAIASFDYGSEEFLISALWSNCPNMILAYKSGDVYLHYAKLNGIVPADGTKDEYKKERDGQKPIILGMSYLMSKYGLAVQLSEATGKTVTEDEAQTKIDEFNDTFPELLEKQEQTKSRYFDDGEMIRLPDGWTCWGDNDNFRSVCNLPVQGLGACIMRKAVELCDRAGLTVVVTLHDALYIEYDAFDFKAIDTLRQCMYDAFVYYFQPQFTEDGSDLREQAKLIRLDGYTWGPDYPAPKVYINEKGKEVWDYESITTPGGLEIEYGDLYVDERAISEYKQFSRYFSDREESLL